MQLKKLIPLQKALIFLMFNIVNTIILEAGF